MKIARETRKHTLVGLISLTVLLVCAQPLRADLLSVAFNSPNQYGPSPLISGPDAASTAVNPLFGAANVWNNLNIPYGVLTTNPTWANLVDSAGAATGVNFSITGNVAGIDFYAFFPSLDPLRSEVVAWNDNGNGQSPTISTTIDWALTGLAANATFDMCVYGSRVDYNRSFNMTIGGTTLNVPSYDSVHGTSPANDCVYFANVHSDASGTITGVGTGIGDLSQYTSEADWSGFQLVQVPDAAAVPEPSSFILIGTGALSLFHTLRKKRFI